MIAFGGDDKKVYLQRVSVLDETLQLVEGEGGRELAMCFDSPVRKLEFCAGGGQLLGVAEDAHVQMMDTETKKVTNFS